MTIQAHDFHPVGGALRVGIGEQEHQLIPPHLPGNRLNACFLLGWSIFGGPHPDIVTQGVIHLFEQVDINHEQ
jgi:hypothetical protein